MVDLGVFLLQMIIEKFMFFKHRIYNLFVLQHLILTSFTLFKLIIVAMLRGLKL